MQTVSAVMLNIFLWLLGFINSNNSRALDDNGTCLLSPFFVANDVTGRSLNDTYDQSNVVILDWCLAVSKANKNINPALCCCIVGGWSINARFSNNNLISKSDIRLFLGGGGVNRFRSRVGFFSIQFYSTLAISNTVLIRDISRFLDKLELDIFPLISLV